jgi:hypothetical protein
VKKPKFEGGEKLQAAMKPEPEDNPLCPIMFIPFEVYKFYEAYIFL